MTIKLKDEKKLDNISLPNVDMVGEYQNDVLKSITFNSGTGEFLFKIQNTDYYGLKLLVSDPPKMVKKYRVEGTISGVKIEAQTFDTAFEAQVFKGKIDDGDLATKEIEVPEE